MYRCSSLNIPRLYATRDHTPLFFLITMISILNKSPRFFIKSTKRPQIFVRNSTTNKASENQGLLHQQSFVTRQEFDAFKADINSRISSQTFIEDKIFSLAALNRFQLLFFTGFSFIFFGWLGLEVFNHRIEINHLFKAKSEGEKTGKDDLTMDEITETVPE